MVSDLMSAGYGLGLIYHETSKYVLFDLNETNCIFQLKDQIIINKQQLALFTRTFILQNKPNDLLLH